MKTTTAIALAASTLILAACSADEPQEEAKGSTTSNFTMPSVPKLPDVPRSSVPADPTAPSAPKDPAQAPGDDGRDERGADGDADWGGFADDWGNWDGLPDLPEGAGEGGDQVQGQRCTTAVSCRNGACTCTSGPNQGQACDGASPTGCSAMCHYCE